MLISPFPLTTWHERSKGKEKTCLSKSVLHTPLLGPDLRVELGLVRPTAWGPDCMLPYKGGVPSLGLRAPTFSPP